MTDSSSTAFLFQALSQSAEILAQAIRSKTSGEGYPQGDTYRGYSSIGDATSIGKPQRNGEKVFIQIIIDLKKAPYAAAFEWGSGVHGARKSTYPILPKKADELVFEWNPDNPFGAMQSPKVNWVSGGNVWAFNKVDHPGISPLPYIQPSISENGQKIREILGEGVKKVVANIVGNLGGRVTVNL